LEDFSGLDHSFHIPHERDGQTCGDVMTFKQKQALEVAGGALALLIGMLLTLLLASVLQWRADVASDVQSHAYRITAQDTQLLKRAL
jgi:hypothetical protein